MQEQVNALMRSRIQAILDQCQWNSATPLSQYYASVTQEAAQAPLATATAPGGGAVPAHPAAAAAAAAVSPAALQAPQAPQAPHRRTVLGVLSVLLVLLLVGVVCMLRLTAEEQSDAEESS